MADASPVEKSAPDIQGGLIGFNKDHQRLLFLEFPSADAGRAFITAMLPEINSARSVLDFNRLFKHVHQRKEDPASVRATWSNIALSGSGLEVIEAAGLDTFPSVFRDGMRQRAQAIGDVGPSDPSTWEAPFDGAQQVHAMVIIAADEPDGLDTRTQTFRTLIKQVGILELGAQDGNVRPGDQKGHEHFGFKDGISQPGIAGWTHASKGGDHIAPGEFLIGYPNQDGAVSGKGVAGVELQPNQPGYPGHTPATSDLPEWATNGSFLVYRRLHQDVPAFHDFLAAQAASVGLSPDQLGAKFIGRWPSGAPLERVPGIPAGINPADVDPSDAHPDVLLDDHINNFEYSEDADGKLTPRAAHIRKSYPRDEAPPGEEESERHRIMRRGIPYGPEVTVGEAPYGSGAVQDDQDRGLLFICYQAALERGFEFVQQQWVNSAGFPQTNDGVDPIIAQSSTGQSMSIPGHGSMPLQNWVTTKGGEYFFVPSISALKLLGEPAAPAAS